MIDTEKDNLGTESNTAQLNELTIKEHGTFENMILEGLKFGGLHITAYKSHGKTRLLFSIAEALQKQEDIKTIIFDSSLTWLFSASRIEVFNIGEHDILKADRKSTEDLEKYQLNNWLQIKYALDTRKDILFNFSVRSPSRRGFFIRTVVNYCDSLQRTEKLNSPEHTNKNAIVFIIEEAQNAINNRLTASSESEIFLSVFNEARNQREAFFTASQRLNDFSKTIRTKQLQVVGKLNAEDITPALKKLKIDFANMKPKNWYFEGLVFESPEFKQQGKPYLINSRIKTEWLNSLPKTPKKKSLKEKIRAWLNISELKENKSPECPKQTQEAQSFFESENLEDSENELDQQEKDSENSELEEIEEEWIK
jgi:hypothetical protein